MLLRLENFRRFYKSQAAHIAPITILLGENSSGKTSFAAALRYTLETMSAKGEGSFNKEPFFLGAFDQISHFRGGRYGRSSHFSLSLRIEQQELQTIKDNLTSIYGYLNPNGNLSFVDVKFTFENEQSQPTLAQVGLSNEFVQLDMKRKDLPQFRLKRSDEPRYTQTNTNPDNIFFKSQPSLMIDRNNVSVYSRAIQNATFYNRRLAAEKKLAEDELAKTQVLERAPLGIFMFDDEAVYASAPFRTRPERTYSPIEASSSAEGAHIPILLAQAKAFDKDRWTKIKDRLEEFGKKSEMFKKIDVKRMGRNLSDPFQIVITVSKDHSNLIDVGYGVSQVLPILVETLANERATFFIFQQPEVHLHPRAQAELGSYFVDFVSNRNKYIVLETHSDFMIDRIRSEIQSRELDPQEYLSVLFFERSDFETKIHRILFDENNNVIDAPEGYRNFFVNEAARNLGLIL